MEVQGLDGRVVADERGITFHYSRLAHRDKTQLNPRHIPWDTIASVTFTESGRAGGHLRVHVVGEPPGAAKPQRHPHCLMANGLKQRAAGRLFAEQVSTRLAQRSGAQLSPEEGPKAQHKSVRDAGDRMTIKMGSRRELRKLAKHHLVPGESVRYAASGRVNNRLGLAALTDRRLLFLFHGMVRQSLEDLPLTSVVSVKERTGVLMGTLTVVASGTELIIKQVAKHDLKTLANALRVHISTGSLPPLPAIDLDGEDGSVEEETPAPDGPAQTTSPDVVDQIARLGELKSSGVLTEEEFEAAKSELLRRL